ncbi:phage tail protein [Streptomyces sp. NPDC002853]
MRGSIDGLGSSAPIGMMLPAVFADDALAQHFVAGLDEVLAPILNVLDCLDTYFDPALTPIDFAQWLSIWVGAETDGIDSEGRLRAAVAAAAALHRVRGTRQGLSEAVRLAFGTTPEITESGGAAWSARPRGPIPGSPRPHLHVALGLSDPTPADTHRLDALVAAARPAHMPYSVTVTATANVTTTERTLES